MSPHFCVLSARTRREGGLFSIHRKKNLKRSSQRMKEVEARVDLGDVMQRQQQQHLTHTPTALMEEILYDLGYRSLVAAAATTEARRDATKIQQDRIHKHHALWDDVFFPTSASSVLLSSEGKERRVPCETKRRVPQLVDRSPPALLNRSCCSPEAATHKSTYSDAISSVVASVLPFPLWTVEDSIRLVKPRWKEYVRTLGSALVRRNVFQGAKGSALRPTSLTSRLEVIDVIMALRWMLRQLLRRWCCMLHLALALVDSQHRDHTIARYLAPGALPSLNTSSSRLARPHRHGGPSMQKQQRPSKKKRPSGAKCTIAAPLDTVMLDMSNLVGVVRDDDASAVCGRVVLRIQQEYRSVQSVLGRFASCRRPHRRTASPMYGLWAAFAVASDRVMSRLSHQSDRSVRRWKKRSGRVKKNTTKQTTLTNAATVEGLLCHVVPPPLFLEGRRTPFVVPVTTGSAAEHNVDEAIRALLMFNKSFPSRYQELVLSALGSPGAVKQEIEEEQLMATNLQRARRVRGGRGGRPSPPPPGAPHDFGTDASLRSSLETIAMWRFHHDLVLQLLPNIVMGRSNDQQWDAQAEYAGDALLRAALELAPLALWCTAGRDRSHRFENAGNSTKNILDPSMVASHWRHPTASLPANNANKSVLSAEGSSPPQRCVSVALLRKMEDRLVATASLRSLSRNFLKCLF